MNELEEHLRRLRLAPPSEKLDHRMQAIFSRNSEPIRPTWRIPRRWWLVTLTPVGLVAVFVILFLLSREPRLTAPLPPLVYEIEAKGLMRELLVAPPARMRSPPVVLVDLSP